MREGNNNLSCDWIMKLLIFLLKNLKIFTILGKTKIIYFDSTKR